MENKFILKKIIINVSVSCFKCSCLNKLEN